jgi:glutamine phosphoribosylpyrophosphate amidotransferase
VHNGIIENHEALRARLKAVGYEFTSDTDTEVVGHLIAYELKTTPDFLAAVCKAIKQLQGAYAIAVLREADPSRVVVARKDRRCCSASPTMAATPLRTPRRSCRSRGAWSISKTATVPN